MLPVATKEGVVTPFSDALFTATSAVCVTGLVVHDTATYWSNFGQFIIVLLIQIGGLGVVTVAGAFGILSGRRIGLMQRSTMQEAMHHGNVVIEPQKILYFEYEGNRKVKLVSTETVYHIIGSMSELENQLQQYHFIMPHKSFLVNVACINSFYNDIILSNGMKIPIAKNRRKQVHEKISDYLHHHLQK